MAPKRPIPAPRGRKRKAEDPLAKCNLMLAKFGLGDPRTLEALLELGQRLAQDDDNAELALSIVRLVNHLQRLMLSHDPTSGRILVLATLSITQDDSLATARRLYAIVRQAPELFEPTYKLDGTPWGLMAIQFMAKALVATGCFARALPWVDRLLGASSLKAEQKLEWNPIRASLLIELGRFEEARATLEAETARTPLRTPPQVLAHLSFTSLYSKTLLLENRPHEAAETFEELLYSFPEGKDELVIVQKVVEYLTGIAQLEADNFPRGKELIHSACAYLIPGVGADHPIARCLNLGLDLIRLLEDPDPSHDDVQQFGLEAMKSHLELTESEFANALVQPAVECLYNHLRNLNHPEMPTVLDTLLFILVQDRGYGQLYRLIGQHKDNPAVINSMPGTDVLEHYSFSRIQLDLATLDEHINFYDTHCVITEEKMADLAVLQQMDSTDLPIEQFRQLYELTLLDKGIKVMTCYLLKLLEAPDSNPEDIEQAYLSLVDSYSQAEDFDEAAEAMLELHLYYHTLPDSDPESLKGSLEEWHNLMSEYLQDSDWPELVEAFDNLDVGIYL